MSGRLSFRKWITREMLRAEPETRFVFGDNLDRVGLGGQAGAMRGEPNAIGVATKRHPGMSPGDFFEDDRPVDLWAVDQDIDLVIRAFHEGHVIVLPLDGLGTGLSELPTRAPKLHRHIINRFRAIAGDDFPWGNS